MRNKVEDNWRLYKTMTFSPTNRRFFKIDECVGVCRTGWESWLNNSKIVSSTDSRTNDDDGGIKKETSDMRCHIQLNLITKRQSVGTAKKRSWRTTTSTKSCPIIIFSIMNWHMKHHEQNLTVSFDWRQANNNHDETGLVMRISCRWRDQETGSRWRNDTEWQAGNKRKSTSKLRNVSSLCRKYHVSPSSSKGLSLERHPFHF